MRFIFFLLCLFVVELIGAQTTFIRPYDLDVNAVVFTSMILDNDTLVVSGFVNSSESSNQSGKLLLKIDTSGHVIWSTFHYADHNQNYSFEKIQRGLIKAPDNSGYYLLGHVFEQASGCLLKFDNNGQFLWQKIYVDDQSRQDYYKKIVKTTGGFYVLGTKQKLDYDSGVFMMKIDYEGNKEWERVYDIDNQDNRFSNFLIIGENEFVISSGIFPPLSTSTGMSPDDVYASRITGVDSLGNVLWDWNSDFSQDERGAANLYYDGYWTYSSIRSETEPDGYWRSQPRFIVRDGSFNIVVSKSYDQADYPLNGFHNMIPMQEGGFLAMGTNTQDTTGLTYDAYNFGWLMRLDAMGNKLWERLDLTPVDTFGTANYWTSAVELESGNIIVSGSCQTSMNFVIKDWGAIIKVDKDGCIDTLCAITDINDLKVHSEYYTNIYPNPFVDILNIDSEGSYQVFIFDLFGRKVFPEENMIDSSQLDLSFLHSGSYFIVLVGKDERRVFKIIKTE